MGGTDLDGHICLVWGIYIIHFLQYRWKFRVLGQKNAPISAEKLSKLPENKNTPFSPERLFYVPGNDSDGHICLVTGIYNTFPSISDG